MIRCLVIFSVCCVLSSPALIAGERETDNAELDSAISLYRKDGPDPALPVFLKLESEFTTNHEQGNLLVTLRYIGESHWRLGEFELSREYLERALSLARETRERYVEGKILNVTGLLEWDLGNFDAAVEVLTRANDIANELDDDLLRASTLNNLSLVLDELGDYSTSLEQYQRAYELFAGAGDLRGEGDALGNMGGVQLLLGRFGEALEQYRKALAISEQLGSKTAMTIDQGNIALCLDGLGRLDEALDHFDTALQLARETGLRQEEAYWQRGKANTLIRKGEYDLGLQNHRAALAIYEESGARGLLLDALHDMGRLHLELGDPLTAESFFNRAIQLARDIGLQQAITANQLALGDLQYERTLYEEAGVLYTQATERAIEAGELGMETEGKLRLSMLARKRGGLELAFGQAKSALDAARKTGSSLYEAEAWYETGENELAAANSASALAAFDTALSMAGSDNPELAWQIHYGKANAQVQTGDRRAAIAELKEAVALIESVRGRLSQERFRSGYIQDKYQVYIDLVRLQMEAGHAGEAFSTAERLRARSFLPQVESAGTAAISEEWRRTEMAMREKIRLLQSALTDEQRRIRHERRQLAIEAYSNELLLAEHDYHAFLDDARGHTVDPQILEVPRIAEIQDRLDAGEALVEFVLDEEHTMSFVLRGEGLYSLAVDTGRSTLANQVALVRDLMQLPGNDGWVKPAHSLYERLILPLLDQGLLDDIERVYLVPHGVLNYLPFALLSADPEGRRLMLDRYTITYLPTAATLVRTDSHDAGQASMLALAPDTAQLKYAPDEARSIAALFDDEAQLLEGASATESAFKLRAGDYSMLHIATHGFLNRSNPLLSGLALEADDSNDGLLQVHEILGVKLDARLVTLSACQTGLGSGYFNEIPAGDEFVGLTRAFLTAGSDSVLATLWEVDDRSTVDLMEAFYRRFETGGGQPDYASALADAQRDLRAGNKFNHPFYWAPFVLVGQHNHSMTQN